MNDWQDSLGGKIWKKFYFDAQNNIKTPLGLVSLMVNIDTVDEQTKIQDAKDFGMEL